MADLEINISLQQYIDQLKQVQSGASAASGSVSSFASSNSSLASQVDNATNTITAQAAELQNLKAQFQAASSTIEQNQIGSKMAAATSSISSLASTTSGNLIPAFTALTGSVGGTLGQMQGLSSFLPGLSKIMGAVSTANGVATASFIALNTASGGILLAIGLVITGIAAAVKMFSDGLQRNAEAQGTFSRALSTVKPIIDLVKQAIDVVVTTFVNLFDTVMSFVPQIVSIFTTCVTTLARTVYKPIIVAVAKVYGTITQFASKVVSVIGDLVTKVGTTISDFLKAMPFTKALGEQLGEFVNTVGEKTQQFADKMNEAGRIMKEETGDMVDYALDKMDEYGQGLAKNMEAERKYTDAMRKYKKEQKELEEQSASAQKKTDELKQQAQSAMTNKEKTEYLNRAKQLNEHLRDRKIALAKAMYDEYNLMLQRQKLVSAAEKEHLAELKKAWAAAGTEETSRLNEINSQLNTLRRSSANRSSSARSSRDTRDAQVNAIKSLQDTVKQGFDTIQGLVSKYISDYHTYDETLDSVFKYYNAVAKHNNYDLATHLADAVTKAAEKAGFSETAASVATIANSLRKGAVFYDIKSLFAMIKDAVVDETKSNKPNSDDYTVNLLADKKMGVFTTVFTESFNNAVNESIESVKHTLSESINTAANAAYGRGDTSLAATLVAQSTNLDETFNRFTTLIASLDKAQKEMRVPLALFGDKLADQIREKGKAAKVEIGDNVSSSTLKSIGYIKDDDGFKKMISDIFYTGLVDFQKFMTQVAEKVNTVATEAIEKRSEQRQDAIASKAQGVEYDITTDALSKLEEYNAALKAATMNAEQYAAAMEQLKEEQEDTAFAASLTAAKESYESYNQYIEELAASDPMADLSAQRTELMRLEMEWKSKQTEAYERDNQKQIKSAEKVKNAEKAASQKRISTASEIERVQSATTDAIVSLGNQIISNKQTQIKADLEAGKITREEAEAQFEATKKSALALAILNTLSTVPAQVLTIWSGQGEVWTKIALTAAIVPATVATLMAQVNQIKSTTLDSSSASSAGSISAASVAAASATPLLDENQDRDRIQSIQGAQDQQVYILEKDIQESNKRVSVREKNATF